MPSPVGDVLAGTGTLDPAYLTAFMEHVQQAAEVYQDVVAGPPQGMTAEQALRALTRIPSHRLTAVLTRDERDRLLHTAHGWEVEDRRTGSNEQHTPLAGSSRRRTPQTPAADQAEAELVDTGHPGRHLSEELDEEFAAVAVLDHTTSSSLQQIETATGDFVSVRLAGSDESLRDTPRSLRDATADMSRHDAQTSSRPNTPASNSVAGRREQPPSPHAFLDTPRGRATTPQPADTSTTGPTTTTPEGLTGLWQRGEEPVAFLRDAVDTAVKQTAGRAGIGMDAFTADPNVLNCVSLMEALLERLHPAEIHAALPGRHAIRPATTVDDSAAGSHRAEDRLVPGGTWMPVSTVDQIITALHQAGRGSTALLLEQGRDDIGHALLYAHIGTDPATGLPHIVRVDPQASNTVEALNDQARRWIRAGRGTRMTVIDPTGRAVDIAALPVQPQSSAPAQSLVDAPTSHHYGMLGMELETEFPVSSDSKESLMSTRTLQLVADEDLNGRSIVEITSRPMRVHSRETAGFSANEVFADVAVVLNRLSSLSSEEGRSLSDVFPESEGFRVAEGVDATVFGNDDPPDVAEKLSIHFTAGVPLTGLHAFLEFTRKEGRAREVVPVIRKSMANLDHGIKFGSKVGLEYLQQHRGRGESRTTAMESRMLSGFTALVYTHLAAVLRYYYVEVTEVDSEVVAKNFTPILSRNPLSAIREALPPRVNEYLKNKAEYIRRDMEDHFTEFNRAVAFVLRNKYKQQNPNLTLLDLVPHAPDTIQPLTHYVRDALDPEYGTIVSPDNTFGTMTTFEKLDNSGAGIPLVLLEIRFFGADPKPDLQTVRQYYDKIASRLSDLYDQEALFQSRNRSTQPLPVGESNTVPDPYIGRVEIENSRTNRLNREVLQTKLDELPAGDPRRIRIQNVLDTHQPRTDTAPQEDAATGATPPSQERTTGAPASASTTTSPRLDTAEPASTQVQATTPQNPVHDPVQPFRQGPESHRYLLDTSMLPPTGTPEYTEYVKAGAALLSAPAEQKTQPIVSIAPEHRTDPQAANRAIEFINAVVHLPHTPTTIQFDLGKDTTINICE